MSLSPWYGCNTFIADAVRRGFRGKVSRELGAWSCKLCAEVCTLSLIRKRTTHSNLLAT